MTKKEKEKKSVKGVKAPVKEKDELEETQLADEEEDIDTEDTEEEQNTGKKTGKITVIVKEGMHAGLSRTFDSKDAKAADSFKKKFGGEIEK